MCDRDAIFKALADSRRRRVLFSLKKHRTVSLADLAEIVVEMEHDEDLAAISAEQVNDVYFSLYHNHVPVLEEADLVHYEQENDLVAWTEETPSGLVSVHDCVESLLEIA